MNATPQTFYDGSMSDLPSVPASAAPTTVRQDLLAAALGALMVLGGGLLLMFGYAWLEEFGVILGAGGAFAWGYWWRNKHEAFFPKDLRAGSVGGTAALVALVGLLFFLAL